MKLNLGCGDDYREGWINADIRPEVDPDLVLNVDHASLPFADNTFEFVLLDNVLEHSHDLLSLLTELHRVTAPGARLLFRGPHWNSAGAWTDPTHTRPFTHETFEHYLVEPFFAVEQVSCTRVRFGRLVPERVALVLADHVGQVVSEVEVVVRSKSTDTTGRG